MSFSYLFLSNGLVLFTLAISFLIQAPYSLNPLSLSANWSQVSLEYGDGGVGGVGGTGDEQFLALSCCKNQLILAEINSYSFKSLRYLFLSKGLVLLTLAMSALIQAPFCLHWESNEFKSLQV